MGIFNISCAGEYRDYAGQEIEYLPNGVDSREYAGDFSKNITKIGGVRLPDTWGISTNW